MSRKKIEIISIFLIAFVTVLSFSLKGFDFDKIGASLAPATNKDRIHFINAGGDAILIESQGHYGLIDAGESPAHVYKYLNNAMGKDKKLDFIILTHTHGDHYGGMPEVIKGVTSDNSPSYVDSSTTLYLGGVRSLTNLSHHDTIIDLCLKKGATVYEYDDEKTKYKVTAINTETHAMTRTKVTFSRSITLKNFTIDMMNLEYDKAEVSGSPDKNANRYSIIQLVTHTNGKKILLTGDIEQDDELRFVCSTKASEAGECRTGKIGSVTEKKAITNIDILKMGHHAKYTSNQRDFMYLTNPKVAIVSGFPHNMVEGGFNFSALNYVSKNGGKIYVTGYDSDDYVDFNTTNSELKKKRSVIVGFNSSTYHFYDGDYNNIDSDYVQVHVEDKYPNGENKLPFWTKIYWNGKTSWLHFTSKDVADKKMKYTTAKTTNKENYCYMFHRNSGALMYGWKQEDDYFYHFNTSTGVKDTVDGYTFATASTTSCDGGYLKQKGWFKQTSKRWFYLDSSYKVITGWKSINSNKYYFTSYKNLMAEQNSNGLMLTGIKYLADESNSDTSHYYYFSEDSNSSNYGAMQIGWQTINGNIYYFKKTNNTDSAGNITAPKGSALIGWNTVGNEDFYFRKTGPILLGFNKLSDGFTYYFKETGDLGDKGKLLTGLTTVNGNKYYLNPTKTSTLAKGAVLTGWIEVDGNMYYFRPASEGDYLFGSAVKSQTKEIAGKSYTFDSNGVCTNFHGIVAKPTNSYCSNPTYSGSAQTITKTPGTGYTFSGNQQTNVGTYAVTASLTDGYMWEGYKTENVTFTCSIVAANINDAVVTVPDQTYTGSAITPTPEIKIGTKTLTNNTDYTLSYNNNINVGTATMIITGKGNYNRTKTVTFNIIDGGIDIINPTNMKLIDNKMCINLAGANSINKTSLFNNIRYNSNKKLYNRNNSEVTVGTAVVGTGYKISTDTISYPIVIYGDIDGTGTVNANDMGIVYRYISSTSSITFDDIAKTAADLDRSGTVNANDLRNIYTIIKRQNQ